MELLELVEFEPTARPFRCNWKLCNKMFRRKSDLQRHYRIHTNDRPFSCIFAGCDKSFIQKSALTVHIRTHTGEKPHQCQHTGCNKRFSDSSSFARHRRIHEGKRPYKCAREGCLKSFSRKITMAKHQRRSHQRGIHQLELDDYYSASESEPLSEPTLSGIQWSQAVGTVEGHPGIDVPGLHRVASYSSRGQHLHSYGGQRSYSNSCRRIQIGASNEYQGETLQDPRRLDAQTLHGAASMPQNSCYMTEKVDPALTTMNTILMPICMDIVYSEMSYTTPAEAAMGDQVLSTFEYNAYEPWGTKALFEDVYMPLPSARLEML